jgi:magnesium-transporting ATPase (P-type)
MVDLVPLATAADTPAKLGHNELEMARQYSETSARVSQALERKDVGAADKKGGVDDLKKELEMWEHKVTVEELCKRLETDPEAGITTAEAKIRLERDGPNTLAPPKVTPWWIKLYAFLLRCHFWSKTVPILLC